MKQKAQERIGRLRLIKLAFHLKKMNDIPLDEVKIITLYKWNGTHRIEVEAQFPSLIIDELANLFADWAYSSTDSELDSIPELFNFFRLSDEEFLHAFDLNGNQKVDVFGGKILNEASLLSDIAENIFAVVSYRKKRTVIDKSGR